MGSAIKGGTTDVSTVIRIVDNTTGLPEEAVLHDTAGIDLWYRRDVDPGSTPLALVSITEAALASLTTAHADGGLEPIGDGYYRLDLPDAAVAGGAIGVLIGGTITGMMVIGNYHELVDYDPNDTVRMGLTALPNAVVDAAGGLVTSAGGATGIDDLATPTNITSATGITLTATTGLGNQTADIAGSVSSVTGSVNDVTTKTGYSLSTAGILAIWHQLTSAIVTASTIGKLLVDNINATITSAATATGFATSTKQDTMETTLNAVPTAAANATQVWEELTATARTAGTYGQLHKDNINGTISSRMAEASINTTAGVIDNVNTVDGNVVGSVGSVSGAVGSVTGAVGSVTGHTNQTGDTYALLNSADSEPPQAAPVHTASLAVKIATIFKFMVNKKTSTATEIDVFNSDELTVDHKSTISDDATTYTEGEYKTGP